MLAVKVVIGGVMLAVSLLTLGVQAHAKVIIDDGNTTKIYLQSDGKQITPAEAYSQALSQKDVLECAHMDIKINAKTGKPSLVKTK